MPDPMVTKPTGNTMQQLAEDAWHRNGEEWVLVFEGRRWSGVELASWARRLSGGLREAGLQPGDRVVICMANCPEVSVTYHAVWRAGAAVTPVLFLLSEDELRHVLTDSEAAFVVTTPEFLPKIATAAQGVPTLRGIVLVGTAAVPAQQPVLSYTELSSGAEADLVHGDPLGLAALLYTGGTTGRSKGVMLSHDALSSAAWGAVSANYEPGLRGSLLPLPLSHAYGMMLNIGSLHAPEPPMSVLMRWFDAPTFVQLVEQYRLQTTALVPSMLQALLALPLEQHDLSCLRRIGSGGAPLPREVAEEVQRRLPNVEIGEGYGLTETAAIISTSPSGKRRAGSVGVPAPGVTVRIERPDGSAAGPGEDGEICVRAPGLMTGYWRAPEETGFAMRGGWLHTGDVGHVDADGYLYVVDRIKDLIIRGGFNVYPRDVEEALLAHPDVVGCAVVGRPDPRLGEEVVAFVQLRPGSTATAEDVVAFGKKHLSAVKYPREVRAIGQIPLTSVGKIDRKALRAMLSG
jgi:long-chain acyl-CoA synthetase